MTPPWFDPDLPLPGSGRTRERWSAFAALAAQDLVAVRLAEGDADARAVLHELSGPPSTADQHWAVWAARPPGRRLTATQVDGGWLVDGRMPYCSGATTVTDALVVADVEDGVQLFAVNAQSPAVQAIPGTWPAIGMAASHSLDVQFTAALAVAVGQIGCYTGRPGYWYGGMGVAACWYGGAVGVARTLADAAQKRDVGPASLAHLGRIDVVLAAAKAMLDQAADLVDASPEDPEQSAQLRASRLRAFVADAAAEVIDRVGRALGAGPLCHDEDHARRVVDLSVYIRQHHAERDLEIIGTDISANGPSW